MAGLVPISGGQGRNTYTEQKPLQRSETPAQSSNPCTRGSQCWQGQTVVAENLFSAVKTILGVRNASRNPHRVAAD